MIKDTQCRPLESTYHAHTKSIYFCQGWKTWSVVVCNVYACLDGAHLEFHLRNPPHETDWKTTHERFKRQK